MSCPWFGLYVHWFRTSNDDCLHDHPWPFLTIILRGGYWEVTPGPGRDRATVSRWHGPGSVRVRPARWLHRIAIDPAHKPVTLVLRGRVGRVWGFETRDGWIPWRGYHGLVDLGYGHVRVDHARDEFAKGPVHINGIEGFWGLAKVRLTKFKGLPKHTFHLHLKETEWRYNHRHANKYRCLLQYLRKNPLG